MRCFVMFVTAVCLLFLLKEVLFKDIRPNCFFASSLRTQIHTPRHGSIRALSNKMNKDRPVGYFFAWIHRSWTMIPIFLLMDHFLYRFSTFSVKTKKIYRLEVRNFCKMPHRIPSFLALCLSVLRFQMPHKVLYNVKKPDKKNQVTRYSSKCFLSISHDVSAKVLQAVGKRFA